MREIPNFNYIVPSRFVQQLQKCQKTGKKFEDSEFPANNNSLNFKVANRPIVWKRISEIMPNAVMT